MTDRRVSWRVRNAVRYAAQQAVTVALRTGGLQKEPCLFENAKCTPGGCVQAHHHDYSRPLDVTWLCPWHHHLVHGRTRRKET